MKQALISPNEPVLNGYRVAEVCDQAFEVAPPMFWAECADNVVADLYYFDSATDTIVEIPQQPAPVEGAQTL